MTDALYDNIANKFDIGYSDLLGLICAQGQFCKQLAAHHLAKRPRRSQYCKQEGIDGKCQCGVQAGFYS